MKLIDTHAHLFWDSFKEDYQEVLDRAVETGVEAIINVGVDLNTSDIVRNLISEKVKFYASVAIHPEDAIQYSADSIDLDESIRGNMARLESMIEESISNHNIQTARSPIVAVGECGLDYLFANHPWAPPSSSIPSTANQISSEQIKDLQRKLLQAHVDLAKKYSLPLLIHCRDDRSIHPENTEAWDEVIKMTKDHFGIYHCYSGLPQTTNYLLKTTNFLVSFASNITYPKNDYLREAVKTIPLDRITLETDCPFLSPQSKRGQRNEPANVLEVAKTIAEIKGITLEEVAEVTTINVKKLLNI